jgi:hypothetical protein
MQGEDEYDSHATIKFSFCHLQDTTMTISHHAMTSSANMPRSGTASTLEMACTSPKTCTLPKASTLSMQKTGVHCQGQVWGVRQEDASVEEGHNKPLAKEGNDEPLAKDGNWAGYNNEPLTTRALATYIVHGNNEPLATLSNWATTFDNCKGAKVPTIKLIVSITTPHHCHRAPKHLQ